MKKMSFVKFLIILIIPNFPISKYNTKIVVSILYYIYTFLEYIRNPDF